MWKGLEYVEAVLDVRFPTVLSVEAQMLMVAAFTCVVLSVFSYSTDRPKAKATSPTENLAPAVPPLSPSKQGEVLGSSYASMRWRYLAVYLPGVFGDWIQGAYLYALYKTYDLSMADIGYLFMIGYSTSALLGTYAASMGDRYGHRACISVYGVIYAVSCATMHSGNFWVLMFGRVCGGVAYSLLYSSFEAWAVAEATHCGHRSKLPALFASSTFCNAMAAVCAGIVGHAAVEWNTPHVEEGAAAVAIGSAGVGVMGGGEGESAAPANMYTLPFDVAVPVLLGCSMGALVWWREHRGGVYGGVMAPSGGVIPVGSIRQAYNEISKAVGLRSIMAMIALYESALYIFVFLWTPALESRAEAMGITSIPHGIIFSLFMTCKMAGSQLFTLVLKGPTHAAHVLAFTFVLSALCFSVPLLSQSYYATLVAFSVYECGLGLYWPAIAILRADLVPDDIRSSVASLFRVPLNGLVVVSLLVMGRMPESVVLLISVAQLTMCVWCAVTVPGTSLDQHNRPHSPGSGLPVLGAPSAADIKADL